MGRPVDEPARLRMRQRRGSHDEAMAEAAMTDELRLGAARAARLDAREQQQTAEQQERVLADVRASLEQFRQRSAKLAIDYVRALGRPLVSASGRTRR